MWDYTHGKITPAIRQMLTYAEIRRHQEAQAEALAARPGDDELEGARPMTAPAQ
jgi:hypothetical protein